MICPYEAFPTHDAWVMIAAASDALFAKACEALGVPGMPRDPRFEDNPAAVAHRAEVFESSPSSPGRSRARKCSIVSSARRAVRARF
jgi:crotonobetainyl-CoA:carnitine CoA-transferase CaiB-like acyl-CoA transferase